MRYENAMFKRITLATLVLSFVVGCPAEKSTYNVELTAMGDKKIQVIKVVRDETGLGLAEAKTLVESAPKVIKEALPKADAEALKTKLEAQGATVTLK